jgi:hypothetical protein
MADLTSEPIGPPGSASLGQWMFNPFRYVAGGKSLVIGLAAILLAGFLGSFSNTHFDGALDVHTGRPAGMAMFLTEGIVDWLSLAITLFVLGKLVSKTAFRAIDLFGTQAMARWPTVIMALIALAPPHQRFLSFLGLKLLGTAGGAHAHGSDLVLGGLLMLAAFVAVIWMVALMYQAYSVSCNVRGGKGAATFIAGVIGAEVVSKIVILRMLMG